MEFTQFLERILLFERGHMLWLAQIQFECVLQDWNYQAFPSDHKPISNEHSLVSDNFES